MTPHPNPLLREERELRWFLFSISSPFSRERMKVRVKGRKEIS
jgi:hypothetical protein